MKNMILVCFAAASFAVGCLDGEVKTLRSGSTTCSIDEDCASNEYCNSMGQCMMRPSEEPEPEPEQEPESEPEPAGDDDTSEPEPPPEEEPEPQEEPEPTADDDTSEPEPPPGCSNDSECTGFCNDNTHQCEPCVRSSQCEGDEFCDLDTGVCKDPKPTPEPAPEPEEEPEPQPESEPEPEPTDNGCDDGDCSEPEPQPEPANPCDDDNDCDDLGSPHVCDSVTDCCMPVDCTVDSHCDADEQCVDNECRDDDSNSGAVPGIEVYEIWFSKLPVPDEHSTSIYTEALDWETEATGDSWAAACSTQSAGPDFTEVDEPTYMCEQQLPTSQFFRKVNPKLVCDADGDCDFPSTQSTQWGCYGAGADLAFTDYGATVVYRNDKQQRLVRVDNEQGGCDYVPSCDDDNDCDSGERCDKREIIKDVEVGHCIVD